MTKRNFLTSCLKKWGPNLRVQRQTLVGFVGLEYGTRNSECVYTEEVETMFEKNDKIYTKINERLNKIDRWKNDWTCSIGNISEQSIPWNHFTFGPICSRRLLSGISIEPFNQTIYLVLRYKKDKTYKKMAWKILLDEILVMLILQ